MMTPNSPGVREAPERALAGRAVSALGRSAVRRPYAAGVVATSAALALSAYANHRFARRAERNNPPLGRFPELDGVRLHLVERGTGEPLVLLHGDGSMVEDFLSSGLIDMAANNFRVIAFDRPGHGHSTRPRSRVWTDAAQADLIAAALAQLGVPRAVVLGHSWGCSVAMALALNHPELVSSLVLASGYYYPSVPADVVVASGPAIPGAGDMMCYALLPWAARAMWPLLTRKIFGPVPVPAKFDSFPRELTFRPSQIRASAADSALMIPAAAALAPHYAAIETPTVIIAGTDDRVVDLESQSARLHAVLPFSRLRRIPGAGHMIHQTATDAVLAAIEEASMLHLQRPA